MGRNGLGDPSCFVAPPGVLSRVEGGPVSQPRSGDIIKPGASALVVTHKFLSAWAVWGRYSIMVAHGWAMRYTSQRSGSMIASWAKEESARVHFGDERLDNRMAILLSELGNRPILSIPAACRGRAETKAAYRFFDNDKSTFEKVIEPHIFQTKQRMAAQELVLLVQDTTEVDLTRPEQAVEGAGELDGVRRGVLLHEIQALVPDGTP